MHHHHQFIARSYHTTHPPPPPPPKVMDTLCSCGEDLALAEMFDEPLIVVARHRKQIDTSTSRRRRLLESKRGEPSTAAAAAAEEQQERQTREDTECVDVPKEDNVRDIVEVEEREEVEEPAKEENSGGRKKLRFGLGHRSWRNKRQSKNQQTPNNRFVQDIIGQSTKKKGVVRENSWVYNNPDSFLDFGEEDVGLIEMLDEADDDLETEMTVQNNAPSIERGTWKKSGNTNNTIDGQESTGIETIYEEMEPRQQGGEEEEHISWFKLMTIFFSRRHKSKQQTTKKQQQQQQHQQGETMEWPVDKDLVMLLEQACRRNGRPNDNVMPYMANLHQDRYDNITSLSGKSIASLGKYMPLRLAEAVVMLLREDIMDEKDADDAVLVEEATLAETWACNETKGWVHQNGGILLLTDV